MKPRVVMDTNVIISALNFRGKPREILDLMRRGEVQFCISPFILEEIKTVLTKDFGWSEPNIQEVMQDIPNKCIQVEPKTKVSLIKAKADDNRILECTVEGKAKFIISGDKRRLLTIRKYEGIRILSPQEFLRQWAEEKIWK